VDDEDNNDLVQAVARSLSETGGACGWDHAIECAHALLPIVIEAAAVEADRFVYGYPRLTKCDVTAREIADAIRGLNPLQNEPGTS